MKVSNSKSSNTLCNGCGNKILKGQDMLDIGMFGGFQSRIWVKLCRNCVHKAYKEMFNY